MSTKQGLLTLIAPQLLEEDLVDFFLGNEDKIGFTSIHVRGHSSEHGGMNIIEQVTGRQQQIQFQIVIEEQQARDICQQLESMYSGVGIHFWFTELTLQGRI